ECEVTNEVLQHGLGHFPGSKDCEKRGLVCSRSGAVNLAFRMVAKPDDPTQRPYQARETKEIKCRAPAVGRYKPLTQREGQASTQQGTREENALGHAAFAVRQPVVEDSRRAWECASLGNAEKKSDQQQPHESGGGSCQRGEGAP